MLIDKLYLFKKGTQTKNIYLSHVTPGICALLPIMLPVGCIIHKVRQFCNLVKANKKKNIHDPKNQTKSKFISTVKFHWDIATLIHQHTAFVQWQKKAVVTDIIWSAPSAIVIIWHATEIVIDP